MGFRSGVAAGIAATVLIGTTLGFVLTRDQEAGSPTQATDDRGVHFPNSEDLAADEMRIISLGTGMP